MSGATLVMSTFTVKSAVRLVIKRLVAIGCIPAHIVLSTKSKEILPLVTKSGSPRSLAPANDAPMTLSVVLYRSTPLLAINFPLFSYLSIGQLPHSETMGNCSF
jgi:hypothetical protein